MACSGQGYPRQWASVAVAAHLGPARFPLTRLLGVVNAPVEDRGTPVICALGVLLLICSAAFWRAPPGRRAN